MPQNRTHIPCVQPREPAGNGTENRFPFAVFFCQLVFQAVIVMRQFDTGPAALPVYYAIFNHERPVKFGIKKFPFVKGILAEPVVGAKGAGGGPALDDLIAFPSQHFFRRETDSITGGFI